MTSVGGSMAYIAWKRMTQAVHSECEAGKTDGDAMKKALSPNVEYCYRSTS